MNEPTAPLGPDYPTGPQSAEAKPADAQPTGSDGAAPTATDVRRNPRIGTIVWGLVVVVYGVVVLALAGGADVDGESVAIVVLGGAGVVFVVGSAVRGGHDARRVRRGGDRPGHRS